MHYFSNEHHFVSGYVFLQKANYIFSYSQVSRLYRNDTVHSLLHMVIKIDGKIPLKCFVVLGRKMYLWKTDTSGPWNDPILQIES